VAQADQIKLSQEELFDGLRSLCAQESYENLLMFAAGEVPTLLPRTGGFAVYGEPGSALGQGQLQFQTASPEVLAKGFRA